MKNFKQLVLLIAITMLAACSDHQLKITGSGKIITENRTVSTFDKVYTSGSLDVNIVQGNQHSIKISADDNVINNVITKVTDNTLNVKLKSGNYNNINVKVNITMADLTGLNSIGSGNMTITDFLNINNLEVWNTGSGNISISGDGNTLLITNSGSGNFNGFSFTSEDCSVNNSGSGNMQVNCTNNLSGANSGSGHVSYKGNPSSVTISNTGSGNITNAG